jgi:uncharacterized 2Fe-2S/4Fe-4S cluster protein (DUF4445 family)
MTVVLPREAAASILTDTFVVIQANAEGYSLAFDIGTTTVVGFLLDGGTELACESARNPQAVYGADVISRIQYALKTDGMVLTKVIRECLTELTEKLCRKAGVAESQIRRVSIVGNPAMQQLFLGINPKNLARLPFSPVLTEMREVAAKEYLPCLQNASLLIVPDISGYVGADTVACMLATRLDQQEDWTLLVDIGTNGEMVLGNKDRLVACSTAAGPALEGANVSCGMRGQVGAIDHVRLVNGNMECSVIGGGKAMGICGSGLIDAAAAALELGLISARGRVQTEDRNIPLTDSIVLTQDDIRQLQLAKGAIAAGIRLMAAHLGIELKQIRKVYLAGAFGTFMDPDAACRIGLLPKELAGKTQAIGNAAGSGAKLLVCDSTAPEYAQRLVEITEFLELANLPDFQLCFAENMRF